MRLLCNGYIAQNAGSVASASHLVLKELLRRGHEIVIVSKKTFIYPEDLLAAFPNLRYVAATNRWTSRVHGWLGRGLGPVSAFIGLINHECFARVVVSAMTRENASFRADAVLFLGLAAFSRIDTGKVISWVQGPPGTDVYSLHSRADLLRRTEGRLRLGLLRMYGWYKMRAGLPDYSASDRVIVGSNWSRGVLAERAKIDPSIIQAIPYPIDFDLLRPRSPLPASSEALHVLWLGRIVPRKRLDLFLDAAALAFRGGTPLRLTVVGGFTFAPGLRRLLNEFPYQDSLHYVPGVPRAEVPALLQQADVLCQPSDDENFGSSVAEAIACGTPTIVGATNGTGDYLCPKSIRLTDDLPETLAAAFAACYARKQQGTLVDVEASTAAARQFFSVETVTDKLERLLTGAD